MAELATGLIDSGVGGTTAGRVAAGRGFILGEGGTVSVRATVEDELAHGTTMAEILLCGAPAIRLLNAQVFTGTLSCSQQQVAAALDWLVAEGARLVNMSFGLRQDRATLRAACDRALRAGVILVASVPARGDPVYPGQYPGVIRATGDARCGVDEISLLATAQADFGAHVRCGHSGLAGASVACARITAVAARFLQDHPRASVTELRDALAGQACYRGPERRQG